MRSIFLNILMQRYTHILFWNFIFEFKIYYITIYYIKFILHVIQWRVYSKFNWIQFFGDPKVNSNWTSPSGWSVFEQFQFIKLVAFSPEFFAIKNHFSYHRFLTNLLSCFSNFSYHFWLLYLFVAFKRPKTGW